MRKIFWDDPYQCELITRIVSVNGNRILLEETIAFSFSGGQESDAASINGIEVARSEMDGQLIYYILPEGHGLVSGERVKMLIDWPRRCRLMRLHFAAELILELVTRKMGILKIGAHIAETKARIDFACHANLSSELDGIIMEYNDIIAADREIKTGFSDVDNQRRFWEIDGFSRVSCGGTHVKSTAEVGYVTLKRVNIGSGKERIEIKLLDDTPAPADRNHRAT